MTQITVEGKLQKSRATVNVNKASIAFRNTNIKKEYSFIGPASVVRTFCFCQLRVAAIAFRFCFPIQRSRPR